MAEPTKNTTNTTNNNTTTTNNTNTHDIRLDTFGELLFLRAMLNDASSSPPEELTAEKLKERLAEHYYAKAKRAIKKAFPEREGQIKINIKDVGLLDNLENKLKNEGFSVQRKMKAMYKDEIVDMVLVIEW